MFAPNYRILYDLEHPGLSPGVLTSSAQRYWGSHGFKLRAHGSTLAGRRGSLWWNLVAFDVVRLKTDLTLVMQPDRVRCKLELNSSFQLLFEGDLRKLQQELLLWRKDLLDLPIPVLRLDGRGQAAPEDWDLYMRQLADDGPLPEVEAL